MSTRKKRIVFSIDQKLEALHMLDKGKSVVDVASSLNVHNSTIFAWKKNRSQIEQPGKFKLNLNPNEKK